MRLGTGLVGGFRVTHLPWRRLLGFSALPLLASFAPLLVLPVLVRAIGANGWADVAIGLSVGAAGSILVNFGWGVLGPASVAPVAEIEANAIYRTSLIMRLALCIPVLPLVFLAAVSLAGGPSPTAAGVMAIAAAIGGLSPAWFFIGRGKPGGVAIWDTIPRLVAALLSLPALLLYPHAMSYALVTLFVTASAWLAIGFVLSARGPQLSWRLERSVIRGAFRDQTSLAASSLASGLYTSLGVALVSVVDFSAVAAFAAADRVRGMGKQGEMAFANGFQSWVASSGLQDGSRRVRAFSAMVLMGAVGLVALVGFTLFLPLLAPILFGPEITVGPLLAFFMGLSLFCTATSMSATFHVLAPHGRARVISIATIAGSVVGAPAIVGGTMYFGAIGAAAGLALAELVVMTIELPVALGVLKKLSGGRP